MVAASIAVAACGSDSSSPAGATTTSATGSTTTTTSGGGGTTTTSTAEGGGGAGAGATFQLEVHTELDAKPGLVLRVNLPIDVADCAALPVEGAPCDDLDGDGLTDAWEDAALDRLRPLQRLDEAEPLVNDASAVLADVGRVAKSGDLIDLFVMLGYSEDYGSCGGFTSHHGDSERVALELERLADGPGDVRVVFAYTAAHEGTPTDHGHVFLGAELDTLVHDADPATAEPRWVVFPSRAKHATYATVDICEGISIVPCFDEDCAPDGAADPSQLDRLPPVVNAGEENAPRVTELSVVGFPGDDAWAKQDFCGGLGGTGCSSPVRDKLLVSPF